MGRYRYSLVRCVPEPRTGEFINIGAIAGSFDEGDWSARQIGNLQRALKLCATEQLGAVAEFIAEASRQISEADETFFPLTDDWLDQIAANHRNVVQLSHPQTAIGDSADDVLDLVFARQLIDPAKATRRSISKNVLLAWIRRYMSEAINDALIVERPVLTVGDRVTATLDFAFGGNRAVALTQAWSFQREGVEDLAKDVKAWAYAIGRLRQDGGARLESSNRSMVLEQDVPIDVLYAPPITPHQKDVFAEATDVFSSLNAHLYSDRNYSGLVEDVRVRVAAGV